MNSSYIISDCTFLLLFLTASARFKPKTCKRFKQEEAKKGPVRHLKSSTEPSNPVAAMVLLLIGITVLHLSSLAMLLISTLEKSWWVWDDSEISDLWYNCFQDNATKTWLCAATNENDWLQSVQALMVLSVVFSSISFLVFLGQLFALSNGGLFYFTGFCQAFAGFTDFAACLIFTFHRKEILSDSRDPSSGRFGYCFILAWICVPLLLLSGVLYVHLRKKH